MNERGNLGARAERLVADRLRDAGFEVLALNQRVGRLELDVIARRAGLLVFCEVRGRSSRAFVDPVATIDYRKRERVRRAALGWLAHMGLRPSEIRFDAAAVLFDESPPAVRYYEAAF